MWVRALLGALVELLDHDGLLPGLAPLQDDRDLTRLVDYASKQQYLVRERFG